MARTAEERRLANIEAVRRWQQRNPEKYAKTQRELREKNPERYRAYNKKQRDTAREYARAEKLRQGCIDCGYSDHPDALQWDHVRGEKEYSPSNANTIGLAKREMEKCEVRCANCHAIRSAQQQRERLCVS